MNFSKTLAALILPIFLVVPPLAEAKRAKVVSQKKVESNFVESKLVWLGRPDPGFTTRWKTKVENGEIMICGAVAYGDIQMRSESNSVLRRAYIVYNNKKIMRNLIFFAKVKRVKNLIGSQANCASTGVKAPKGRYTVSLGWASGSAKG